MNGCNCLCKVVHPSTLGVCRGVGDEVVPFYAKSTGQVDVRMCVPCAHEARKRKRRRVGNMERQPGEPLDPQ